jgi:2-polyprenyl-3-methyl-5-hydroxy-6-metoxy-1,4-benzoquinol methylase
MREKFHSCRLCHSVDGERLLLLRGFPSAAQLFFEHAEDDADSESVDLDVWQCSKCGLIQLVNEPVEYYRDVITAASLSEASKLRLVDEWRPFVERYDLKGKRVIEVGCGKGDFLQVLTRLGLDTTGLEHSAPSTAHAKARGIAVENVYLEQYNVPTKYDLVVCNNYLEHQPRTSEFLKSLLNLVSDRGVVYISVPNIEYLLKKCCFYEFVIDHLVYFDTKTLRYAVEMHGFEVIESYEKNNGNDIVIVARKRQHLDLSAGFEKCQRVINSVSAYLKNTAESGKSVGVWGAGHRSIALMALANAKSVSVVVDSAEFKQNKYTPILRKKIISPEMLKEADLDVLILMLPGSYASQVIDYLRHQNLRCETIVFNDEELV